MKLRLNRESRSYLRATEAGFFFGELRLMDRTTPVFGGDGDAYELTFTCVCGREERFRTVINERDFAAMRHGGHQYVRDGLLDAVAMLERLGSFGREHLKEDGYSPEEIDRIREPWEGDMRRRREMLARYA